MKPGSACEATRADTPDAARSNAAALSGRVLHALERVTWPAHPATLIESAERSGAPRDVIDALRRLPDEAFGSFPEVSALIVAAQLGVCGSTAQRGSATQG
ncbi:DUF2795 domain-containing protein [Paraburkholderia silvatlantica]|uniref:Uncharacterized protein DUF2795 n=1 Tax=Paraburkholderia silvatlantica TaxID=321895 RepID=A0A2U1A8K3_9BURK|nr:DUF2795 domain-containing protein [Paraburkholderia silvatlantica]MBB2929103.1 hypothetical protein [Paraburkholderia silvatlantica]PVY29198.1 uncharacterized protein DUF2795 [Paraburkholderia silvatlantica]PXW36673.1 uncharacterized protein DUF2795 [Paraburkholderia silvatlantica]PYE22157.1 uncharacterized protein DUF2795 [Paraburkholderia silvatlantica]TDQ99061.1 uncharacterized protein DUF2795 [Paraburkholderia silvatlantica]